ncbi:MAG: helix-turn-helix domain-containing protein [Candidatus Diapherotrites archaeon]|nr:helix-turn-helix domain-containing protein [Candidatus Diapherotrites archaeon]
MWVLRAKIFHEDSFGIKYCIKYGLTMYGYPLSITPQGKQIIISLWHFIQGEEKNVKKYYAELKKEKKLFNIETNGNILIYSFSVSKNNSHWRAYANPSVVFLKPAIIHPNGDEFIELGTWKKEILTKFIESASKKMKINILSLKKEKAPDIFIPFSMPKLSEKQRRCLDLAYENGYYSYPRMAKLEELAKKAKISYTTFQEHLRKAEAKIMPFFLEQTKADKHR